jgi:hypothetical protein
MSLPITIKEFFQDPIKSILFLSLIAIMYLYIDNRMVYKSQIERQEKRIEVLEKQVEDLQNKLLETVKRIQ